MSSTLGSSTNTILKIFKSRTNVLKHLNYLDYNIDDYTGFSINEIDAMYCNSQLDMLASHSTENKKIYVKYYLASIEARKGTNTTVKNTKQISKTTLTTIIEDLYEIENVLTKDDTLIVIIDEEPNDTILNYIKYLYEKDGIFIVIHNIKRLQFDILTHELVPVVKILSTDDSKKLMDKLNIKTLSQMPEISRFDPVSLAILLRPSQIVCFERKSSTAISTKYYRVCV
jgi:DNA-directed RNA polymerase subunit H (RpoH/RPB5)